MIAPAIMPDMMVAEAAGGGGTAVVAVVNGTPITSGDVAKRVNFCVYNAQRAI